MILIKKGRKKFGFLTKMSRLMCILVWMKTVFNNILFHIYLVSTVDVHYA